MAGILILFGIVRYSLFYVFSTYVNKIYPVGKGTSLIMFIIARSVSLALGDNTSPSRSCHVSGDDVAWLSYCALVS